MVYEKKLARVVSTCVSGLFTVTLIFLNLQVMILMITVKNYKWAVTTCDIYMASKKLSNKFQDKKLFFAIDKIHVMLNSRVPFLAMTFLSCQLHIIMKFA